MVTFTTFVRFNNEALIFENTERFFNYFSATGAMCHFHQLLFPQKIFEHYECKILTIALLEIYFVNTLVDSNTVGTSSLQLEMDQVNAKNLNNTALCVSVLVPGYPSQV